MFNSVNIFYFTLYSIKIFFRKAVIVKSKLHCISYSVHTQYYMFIFTGQWCKSYTSKIFSVGHIFCQRARSGSISRWECPWSGRHISGPSLSTWFGHLCSSQFWSASCWFLACPWPWYHWDVLPLFPEESSPEFYSVVYKFFVKINDH